MVNIIKEELMIEESLKKKIEFICDFAKVKPTIIRKLPALFLNEFYDLA